MSVDKNKTLQRLQTYNESPSPILSFYLQVPISTHQIRHLIQQSLSNPQKEAMKKNLEYIEGFVAGHNPSRTEKTIAIFSGGDNLFEVIHLPYVIQNALFYSHSPYVQPLFEAQEDTRRYFVILSDRKKAIFYTLYSGFVEDRQVITDNSVPQNVKGRWPEVPYAQREDKMQRHIQDHLHRHFIRIADYAEKFIKHKPISGVILGGHKTEMSQFEKYLPKPLKEKIVGKFVSELKINFNEIVSKSKTIIDQVDKQFNQQLSPYLS